MEITNGNGTVSYIQHKFLRLVQFYLINNNDEKNENWSDNCKILTGIEIIKLLAYVIDISIYICESRRIRHVFDLLLHTAVK